MRGVDLLVGLRVLVAEEVDQGVEMIADRRIRYPLLDEALGGGQLLLDLLVAEAAGVGTAASRCE
jgi:hypothetical protein